MKNFFIANWKMNGSKEFIQTYFEKFKDFQQLKNQEVVFCPSILYGSLVLEKLPAFAKLGAQDCHYEIQGAFTGDVSPLMLKENGYTYVILGHSERRSGHFESNNQIQKKATQACQQGLIPIICVGEGLSDRLEGKALSFVLTQLKQSLPLWERTPFIIAYEPLWAIGTGQVAQLSDIKDMHKGIKEFLKTYYEGKESFIPVLYGGSVTPANVGSIMALPCVDGVLVGGASLEASTFIKLLESAG